LPADETLARAFAACVAAGFWVTVYDNEWRVVSMSDDVAAFIGEEAVPGAFLFGPEYMEARLSGSAGANSLEENREVFRRLGGWLVADLAGGRDELRARVHPELSDLVDELRPQGDEVIALEQPTTSFGMRVGFASIVARVRDPSGRFVGAVHLNKPALPMGTLFMMTASGDVGHFQRMQQLAAAGRRSAAILFADLEGSTPLAKTLPTATYFTLVRRLTRAFDQCVVDGGGLVGRHAGDGVAAFFVAETAGSESAAAASCIEAARALRTAARDVAARNELDAESVSFRAGLHWGTSLYIGSIITTGRTEITALGDEVNEAARLEACASGGRLLASKQLVERLNDEDARALGIDSHHLTYTQVADLDTATEKARRDAPAIAVYDLADPGPRPTP
jgi:class 3 adenylate cyclase